MLGDNVRRLQADELDADWDRLIRNDQATNTSDLSILVHHLAALIPPADLKARSRVHEQAFAGTYVNFEPRQSLDSPQAIEFAPSPLRALPSAPAKRWWSSPMAALEVLVACLVIAALALGISAYQSDDGAQQTQSEPRISGGQEMGMTLQVYPSVDIRPISLLIFDVTVDPASTWFGLDDLGTSGMLRVSVFVISGELYTENMATSGPIQAGRSTDAMSFLRNNDRETPLVVRVAIVALSTEQFPESTRNTSITPIAMVPIERPEGDTIHVLTIASGEFTGAAGENLDQLITLDDEFVAVESGSLRVEARGDVPIQIGRLGDASISATPAAELGSGESTALSAGDTVTFAGVDRAPRFTFIDSSPVSLLTVEAHTSPLQLAYVTTQPQSIQWSGPTGDGTIGIIVRELTFGARDSFYYDFSGVSFFRVVSGTIKVIADSGEPIILTPGQTYALIVNERLGLENISTGDAVVVQAEIFDGNDFEHAWGNSPSMSNMLRKRLAIAEVTLPVQAMDISFSWIDSTNIDRGLAVKSTNLIVNTGDPLTLNTSTGGIGIQSGNENDLESIVPYTFEPVTAETTMTLGTGDTLLAQGGSVFNFSAPEGANVFAYNITIHTSQMQVVSGNVGSSPLPEASPTSDGE